jgi:hypothetical protein
VTALLYGCRAMNRSLPNVILGNWAAKAPSVTAATGEKLEHQEIDAPSAAEVGKRTGLQTQLAGFVDDLLVSCSAASCMPTRSRKVMLCSHAGPDAGEEGHHRAWLWLGGCLGAGDRGRPGVVPAQKRRRCQVRAALI